MQVVLNFVRAHRGKGFLALPKNFYINPAFFNVL